VRDRFLSSVRLLALVVAVLTLSASLLGGSAGATSTPPPTPVGSHESPSPFPTVLDTPHPRPAPPRIAAKAAVLEDMRTGQVLYGKASTQRRPIASLTKVMTALLALRRSSLSDVVTIDRETAHTPPSNLSLKVGEQLSVRDLLYGLLLSSANDAAVALAEHVSGSVSPFVRLMNRTACATPTSRVRTAWRTAATPQRATSRR